VKLTDEFVPVQPIRHLMQNLIRFATPENCLFTPHDLRALLPNISNSAFKTVLSRASQEGHLTHFCRGLYLYQRVAPSNGLLLFHAAARIRANEFNYISLETVLSEAGVISQLPINFISIMSSGRSNSISCGQFGTIDFVHTRQKPEVIGDQLYYDARCKLWKACIPLALRDMRATHRNLDLINWSIVDELI
jgi:hypothetical protein